MKAGAYFAAATAGLIVVSWLLLRLGFSSAADRQALLVSAGVAWVVQLASFAIARGSSRRNLVVSWGIGTVLRMIVLGFYAFLVAPALGLPLSAALVSLVTFFFVSMLVEPLLLAYDR